MAAGARWRAASALALAALPSLAVAVVCPEGNTATSNVVFSDPATGDYVKCEAGWCTDGRTFRDFAEICSRALSDDLLNWDLVSWTGGTQCFHAPGYGYLPNGPAMVLIKPPQTRLFHIGTCYGLALPTISADVQMCSCGISQATTTDLFATSSMVAGTPVGGNAVTVASTTRRANTTTTTTSSNVTTTTPARIESTTANTTASPTSTTSNATTTVTDHTSSFTSVATVVATNATNAANTTNATITTTTTTTSPAVSATATTSPNVQLPTVHQLFAQAPSVPLSSGRSLNFAAAVAGVAALALAATAMVRRRTARSGAALGYALLAPEVAVELREASEAEEPEQLPLLGV